MDYKICGFCSQMEIAMDKSDNNSLFYRVVALIDRLSFNTEADNSEVLISDMDKKEIDTLKTTLDRICNNLDS